jgi:hypothetical protein
MSTKPLSEGWIVARKGEYSAYKTKANGYPAQTKKKSKLCVCTLGSANELSTPLKINRHTN